MNALILGLGRMGRFHYRALTDLGHSVTTVDPAGHGDYTRTPDRPYDIVCVATPIAHLAEHAAGWAGRTGHLLIEKPMAATHAQAIELAALLRGQPTAVGYVERFNPQARNLKQHVKPGTVGHFTRWNDRPTTDPILDLRSHDIDLAEWLGVTYATYDTRAPMPIRRRHIQVTRDNHTHTADLLAHTTSPLHAQWQDLLDGGTDYCTPAQAARVLAEIDATTAVAA